MKLHDLKNTEDMHKVAQRMWNIVQEHNPELKQVIDELVADERLNRKEVIYGGFLMGATFALNELMTGNIVEANYG